MNSKTDNYNELITIIENLKKVINQQSEKICILNKKIKYIEEAKANSINDSNNFEYIDSF